MSKLEIRPNLLKMTDDADRTVFTTAKASMVVLQRFAGTIVVGGHSPEASLTAWHTIDHPVGADLTVGAAGVVAWGKIDVGSSYIPANRAFNFSESVVLDGVAYKSSGWAQIIAAMVVLTPVFSGGQMAIREEYICHKNTGGGYPTFPGVSLPSYTVQYDIRTIGWVGGF